MVSTHLSTPGWRFKDVPLTLPILERLYLIIGHNALILPGIYTFPQPSVSQAWINALDANRRFFTSEKPYKLAQSSFGSAVGDPTVVYVFQVAGGRQYDDLAFSSSTEIRQSSLTLSSIS